MSVKNLDLQPFTGPKWPGFKVLIYYLSYGQNINRPAILGRISSCNSGYNTYPQIDYKYRRGMPMLVHKDFTSIFLRLADDL